MLTTVRVFYVYASILRMVTPHVPLEKVLYCVHAFTGFD